MDNRLVIKIEGHREGENFTLKVEFSVKGAEPLVLRFGNATRKLERLGLRILDVESGQWLNSLGGIRVKLRDNTIPEHVLTPSNPLLYSLQGILLEPFLTFRGARYQIVRGKTYQMHIHYSSTDSNVIEVVF